MENFFPYSNDNKRYHTLNFHMLEMFGKRVFKASVNAGFSCPNIDGKVGFGGCSYCTCGGSEFTLEPSVSVKKQIETERKRITAKWGNVGIIAYFQANSNTYASVEKLREIYFEALDCDVCGISIATRCDCIDEDVLSLLKEVNQKTYLSVELGLQTIHDETANLINRGHSFNAFLNTYKRLKEENIRVCVHLINGLINETEEMMLESAKVLGLLKPDAVKIHLLHIMKNTRLLKEYEKGLVVPMEKENYIKVVCNQLCYLPPATVIERLTGDGSKSSLVAPLWSLDKISVLGGIDKFMAENNLTQGMYYKG